MDKLSFSAEFFPPRTVEAEEALWPVVKAFSAAKPRFLTVTYGAGGTTQSKTLEIAVKIQDMTGIPTATHLTCVGAKKEDIYKRLDLLWESGIKHIVALRGDPPKGRSYPNLDNPDYYHYGSELVAAIKAHNSDFEVSVGAYPECHPQCDCPDKDLSHLKHKMEQGADRAITQFFFEKGCFQSFAKKYEEQKIQGELVAGLVAINNYEGIKRFSKNCGTCFPDWMCDMFEGNDDHELVAINIIEGQLRELIDSGVDTFHFYAMNQANPTLRALNNIRGVA